MIRYLIAAAVLLLPLTAAADEAKDTPDWLHIDTTQTNTEVYARKADLLAGRGHQTDARVWLLFDYSRDRTVQAREAKALYSVNCPAKTYRKLTTTVYYPDGTNNTWKSNEGTKYVIPDSNMAMVVGILCYTPTADDGIAVPGSSL